MSENKKFYLYKYKFNSFIKIINLKCIVDGCDFNYKIDNIAFNNLSEIFKLKAKRDMDNIFAEHLIEDHGLAPVWMYEYEAELNA